MNNRENKLIEAIFRFQDAFHSFENQAWELYDDEMGTLAKAEYDRDQQLERAPKYDEHQPITDDGFDDDIPW